MNAEQLHYEGYSILPKTCAGLTVADPVPQSDSEPQNLLLHPRQIVYFGSKGRLPREFFKFMVSPRLAPGFNIAIFDDFLEKHKGDPCSQKNRSKNRKNFFSR